MENITAICHLCKLSIWEWNVQNNNFQMMGYFGTLHGPLIDFLNMVHPFDRNILEKTLWQFMESKLLFEKTFRIQRSEGISKWLFMRGHVSSENIMCGIIVGINNWKKNQDNHYLHQLKLMEANQHHSRNEVISLLAHELTQPLMIINTYISGCIYRLQENKLNHTQLIDIMNNIKHHATLMGNRIHELKNFLKESHLEYSEEYIHEVINEAILLLSYELQMQGISIHFNFQDNLPKIKMNKNQIKQVLYNLLKITIENAYAGFNNVTIYTKKINQHSIKVSILDNTPQPEPVKRRSIKNQHKCEELQLGLAMCRTIIEAHGGKLSFQSTAEGNHYHFTLHS